MKRLIAVAAVVLLSVASYAWAAPKDATLTMGFKSETPTHDPHTESSQLSNMTNRWVMQTIMHRTPKGELIHLLAKSHKWVTPKILEFTLRPGIKFTNGEDMDAHAVKYSMERVFDKKLKSRQRRRMRVISKAKGGKVEVVSKYVVRFHLAYPDVGFVNRLGNVGVIIPPKYYSSKPLRYLATHPVGSGPYILKKWARDDHRVYEANPNFWDPRYPKVKHLVVKVIPEAGARVAALIKGEVDVVFNVPPAMWDRVNKSGVAKVVSKPSIRIFRLGFYNKWGGVLDNKKLREAVARAVDRKTLRESVLKGSAEDASVVLHPWTEGYRSPKDYPYPYEYNPALSKKLLAEAGYPNGIDIELMANTNHLKTREAGQVLAGMLRKANIRVKLVQLSPRSFRNSFRKHRKKPGKGFKPFLFFNSFGGGGGDSDLQLGSIFGCRGSWSGWCDKKIEKMIDQASANQDYKKRDEIFSSIAKKGSDDLSVVPLYRLHATFGLRNRVDWDPRVDERIMAWEIGLTGSN